MTHVMNLKTALALCFFSFATFQSCIEKDISIEKPEPEPTEEETHFDFSLKKEISVNIDYGFSSLLEGGNYQVIFELYKEVPYIYDALGNRKPKTSVEPVYSAWTDKDGRYQGEIILPDALTEVYLVCHSIGAVDLVKLTIENKQLVFDQKTYLADLQKTTTTKAANSWQLPGSNWHAFGNWTNTGLPDYLMAENKQFSESFFNDMNAMFASVSDNNATEDIWKRHPEFFVAQNGKKTDMDLHFIKDTRVSMSVIRTMADFKSTIGYYVYKTSEKPTKPSDINAYYITFPHVSKTSPVSTGNQVRLMFPGANGLTETFPAGYSIGFFMAINGFESGHIHSTGNTVISGISVPRELVFSTNGLNDVSKSHGTQGQRTVALFEPNTLQMIALGFEDYPSWDKDFNDALLNIFVEQPKAISTDDMPELEDTTPEDTTPTEQPLAKSAYEGMLLFEDLWPSQGDYDMNDLMVSYHSRVYRDKSNSITKVEDVFTPVWNGAHFINGFGYQYGSGQVKHTEINYGAQPASELMQGQSSEPDQSKQTYILIDNMHTIIKNEPISITTEFVAGSISNLVPPYNPFIIVHSDRKESPRSEVHLINHLPTDLANRSELGTSDDKSNPDKGIYYVTAMKYPFSLDIPKFDFSIINESIKIDIAYPSYNTWVESNGREAKNWYESPNPNFVH